MPGERTVSSQQQREKGEVAGAVLLELISLPESCGRDMGTTRPPVPLHHARLPGPCIPWGQEVAAEMPVSPPSGFC